MAPLPASLQLFFFFRLGGWGGREGEADLQTPRLPQPSSESIVTRGPAAPFGPRYLSPSPLAADSRPRARGPRVPGRPSRVPPLRLLSALVAPSSWYFLPSPRRRKRKPLICRVLQGTASSEGIRWRV